MLFCTIVKWIRTNTNSPEVSGRCESVFRLTNKQYQQKIRNELQANNSKGLQTFD